jgi:hypothetical protein
VTDTGGGRPDESIPHLNLELERTRIEFRETVRAIESRIDVVSRYRRWRRGATGVDRAFPVALVAGAVIVGIAAIGIVQAARARR